MEYPDRTRDRAVPAGLLPEIGGQTDKMRLTIGGTAMLPVIATLMALALVGYCETLNAFGAPISLAVLIAIFVSASVSSVVGFAFSAMCGAILFHLLRRPVHVIEIMIVCSVAIQLFSVIALRNPLNWQCLSRLLIGGLLGLPVGIYLLIHTSPWTYIKCFGAFLVAYGIYMVVRHSITLKSAPAAADCVVGLLGGTTGGFAAFPSVFVTIWCGFKGWSKDQQRGVYQPFILIMQVLALLLLSFAGASSSRVAGFQPLTLAYVPAALFGTWCGISIFRRLTDVQFSRWVNILLIVSGIGLLL